MKFSPCVEFLGKEFIEISTALHILFSVSHGLYNYNGIVTKSRAKRFFFLFFFFFILSVFSQIPRGVSERKIRAIAFDPCRVTYEPRERAGK